MVVVRAHVGALAVINVEIKRRANRPAYSGGGKRGPPVSSAVAVCAKRRQSFPHSKWSEVRAKATC